MTIIRSLALLVVIGTAADAAVLPLKPGTYVLAGTPCDQPPFAAVMTYDGRAFAYPHAGHCRSAIRARSGRTYTVDETCSALGDGTKTSPTTTTATYTVQSQHSFVLQNGGRSPRRTFRRCATPIAQAFR